MAMTKYDWLPQREAGRVRFMEAFAEFVASEGAAVGFTAAEIAQYQAEFAQVQADVRAAEEAELAYRAAVQRKKEAMGAGVALTRSFVRRMQAYPATTDAQRRAAGVTVRDEVATAQDPQFVQQLAPPEVRLDWSKRGRVGVHFGQQPENEQRNGLPRGISRVRIQWAIGEARGSALEWEFLDDANRSPYTHDPGLNQTAVVHYRVAYVDRNNRVGSWSEVANAAVTV